jgi:hypothetical protein
MDKQTRLTLVEVLFALGCLGVILVLVLVVVPIWRSRPRRLVDTPVSPCMDNMYKIGASLFMYHEDFGTWPTQPTNAARLGIIRALYVDSDRTFQCPLVPGHKFSFDATKREVIGSDYYLEGPIPANANLMRAVAGDYNKDGMNHHDGSVILFLDTHVNYIKMLKGGQHPSPYIKLDKDIYAIDTKPRDKDDADLD